MENLVKPLLFLKQFSGKKVLITGHTGFKGVWLSIWLKKLGAEVTGFALPPENPNSNFFTATKISKDINSNYGDLNDFSNVSRIVQDCEPEIIFHLGAQALVRRSYNFPLETFSTNIMGTANVLEAARKSPKTKAIVIITSDKCYRNDSQKKGYKETDPMGGADPYSSSKGCAELITEAYRRSFYNSNKPPLVASARAGNVIGGGDWSTDRLIPDLANAIFENQPIVLRNPSFIRPWQHVLDPLCGYLMLASKLLDGNVKFAEGWNFGPPNSNFVTVRDLVAKFVEHWGVGEIKVSSESTSLHEEPILVLDSTKAFQRLNFSSNLKLDTAIKYTVEWYRRFASNPLSARSLCEEQLNQYMTKHS